MPKGWTEERRKKYKATIAARRREKPVKRITPVTLQLKGTKIKIDEGFVEGFNKLHVAPLTDLDRAIEQTRADLEALERAKAIMERRASA